ncbi:MAG: Hpt domain-containing protein [Gemmatimonadota bacterium]
MDVRRYADLFLTESRDHLTAFNHLLLEWERDPAAPEPVGGIFRAVHTIKGMAATYIQGIITVGARTVVLLQTGRLVTSSERISLEAIQAEPVHG